MEGDPLPAVDPMAHLAVAAEALRSVMVMVLEQDQDVVFCLEGC